MENWTPSRQQATIQRYEQFKVENPCLFEQLTGYCRQYPVIFPVAINCCISIGTILTVVLLTDMYVGTIPTLVAIVSGIYTQLLYWMLTVIDHKNTNRDFDKIDPNGDDGMPLLSSSHQLTNHSPDIPHSNRSSHSQYDRELYSLEKPIRRSNTINLIGRHDMRSIPSQTDSGFNNSNVIDHNPHHQQMPSTATATTTTVISTSTTTTTALAPSSSWKASTLDGVGMYDPSLPRGSGGHSLPTQSSIPVSWAGGPISSSSSSSPQPQPPSSTATATQHSSTHTIHQLYKSSVCKYCHRHAPPRTYHCKQCHRCVPVLDHHCVYLGTCIGQHNFTLYLHFLCLLLILSIGMIVLILYYFILYTPRYNCPPPTHQSISLICVYLGIGLTGVYSSTTLLSRAVLVLQYNLTYQEQVITKRFMKQQVTNASSQNGQHSTSFGGENRVYNPNDHDGITPLFNINTYFTPPSNLPVEFTRTYIGAFKTFISPSYTIQLPSMQGCSIPSSSSSSSSSFSSSKMRATGLPSAPQRNNGGVDCYNETVGTCITGPCTGNDGECLSTDTIVQCSTVTHNHTCMVGIWITIKDYMYLTAVYSYFILLAPISILIDQSIAFTDRIFQDDLV